jgi:DNA-binding MarR family transcriptional regulator
MNNSQKSDTEEYRALQILDELSNNNSLTQRELSKRLGIALGLVNSYIKNLIKKGYITVKSIPPKRYVYYLTPKGFTEKTRLTYRLLQDYTRIYREARANLKKLFQEIQSEGTRRVVFAGADEVAEIAYITLQETKLELVGVMDDSQIGKEFFAFKVHPLKNLLQTEYDVVIIASYLKRGQLYEALKELGIEEKKIKSIFVQ